MAGLSCIKFYFFKDLHHWKQKLSKLTFVVPGFRKKVRKLCKELDFSPWCYFALKIFKVDVVVQNYLVCDYCLQLSFLVLNPLIKVSQAIDNTILWKDFTKDISEKTFLGRESNPASRNSTHKKKSFDNVFLQMY